MPPALSMVAGLSGILVAFTIEFDNEFEHRKAHQTTRAKSQGKVANAVWLTSEVMWSNTMRHLDADGVSELELHRRSHTTRNSLGGLKRWGYLTQGDDGLLRPTIRGAAAQRVWDGLGHEIEGRWRHRHGDDALDNLRAALLAVCRQLPAGLPAYLPVVFPAQGAFAEQPHQIPDGGDDDVTDDADDLSVLLSHVLLAFTRDVETSTSISLPLGQNTMRVLGDHPTRVRDLPARCGISKEATSMILGELSRRGHVIIGPDPTSSRGRAVRLSPKGLRARESHDAAIKKIENQWARTMGTSTLASLRDALRRVAGTTLTVEGSRLFAGIEPYPDGWRARVRQPTTLPHYPVVLHRGGFPDGS